MRRINFLRRDGEPAAGRVLLVFGLLSLAISIALVQRWETQRRRQEAEARALADAEVAQRQRSSVPAPPSQDELRASQAAPALAWPWLPTLRLIESTAAPPIYLTAMSIDSASREVRLEGEAPAFTAALEFTKSLSEPGLVSSPQLLAHEQRADGTVRFSARATWTLQ